MNSMSEELDVVNLDECSSKVALRFGGGLAFVLTLFPSSYVLCCLPLVFAGFAATTTFIFKNKVRISAKIGMKIGIQACLLGFAASTVVYDLLWLGFDYRIGLEFYIGLLQRLAESAPAGTGDQLLESIELLREQTFSLGVAVQQVFTILVAAGIGGAIGGALASASFKKGALAQ